MLSYSLNTKLGRKEENGKVWANAWVVMPMRVDPALGQIRTSVQRDGCAQWGRIMWVQSSQNDVGQGGHRHNPPLQKKLASSFAIN